MKYIVFENTENYEDSIVLIADKNIKTIENPDNNIKAGYGNYKIHEPSGGLVFDNLRLLRHFFEGARDVFGEGDSCYGSPTDDEKMKRKTMTCFIYEFLTASHIKREMELEGGLNVGLYYIEDDQDSETYNSYLDYINFIEKDLHFKKINGDSCEDSIVQNDEPKEKLFDVEFMDGICQKNIVCTWERLGQIKIEKPYIVKFKIKERK